VYIRTILHQKNNLNTSCYSNKKHCIPIQNFKIHNGRNYTSDHECVSGVYFLLIVCTQDTYFINHKRKREK
jgi:hypothetical protein